MKQFLSLILIAFLFTSFSRGVGNASLTCISPSGRTLFEADFEEYDGFRNGKLTIDKKSIPFTYNDHYNVVFDPAVKVYTLNIESESRSNFDTARYIQLWAIPTSFQEVPTEGTGFRDIYKFDAKLKARDPRKGKEFETPVIIISCRLTYANP